MTVGELIEKLKAYPESWEVCIIHPFDDQDWLPYLRAGFFPEIHWEDK